MPWRRLGGTLLPRCPLSHLCPHFTRFDDSQTLTVQTEKAKRLTRRSLMLNDIQRIESLAKFQTSLASLPSSIFKVSSTSLTDVVSRNLRKHQEQGRVLRRRLDRLRADVTRNIESVVLYDQLVRLTQEVQVRLNQASLLSSHHLISPRSRFSVCLLYTSPSPRDLSTSRMPSSA